MTTDIRLHELVFSNADAIPKTVTLRCDKAAVPLIMAWYGAYYSGDRYSVHYNGREVAKDRNGERIS